MTVRNVNKALAAAGYPDFRLVRGKGYYYFVGPDTEDWYTTSVGVYHVDQHPLDYWVLRFEQMGEGYIEKWKQSGVAPESQDATTTFQSLVEARPRNTGHRDRVATLYDYNGKEGRQALAAWKADMEVAALAFLKDNEGTPYTTTWIKSEIAWGTGDNLEGATETETTQFLREILTKLTRQKKIASWEAGQWSYDGEGMGGPFAGG